MVSLSVTLLAFLIGLSISLLSLSRKGGEQQNQAMLIHPQVHPHFHADNTIKLSVFPSMRELSHKRNDSYQSADALFFFLLRPLLFLPSSSLLCLFSQHHCSYHSHSQTTIIHSGNHPGNSNTLTTNYIHIGFLYGKSTGRRSLKNPNTQLRCHPQPSPQTIFLWPKPQQLQQQQQQQHTTALWYFRQLALTLSNKNNIMLRQQRHNHNRHFLLRPRPSPSDLTSSLAVQQQSISI